MKNEEIKFLKGFLFLKILKKLVKDNDNRVIADIEFLLKLYHKEMTK